MIASIQGKIAATYADHLVVMVGGIGYKVFVPHSSLSRIANDEVFLHTLLVVREDSLTLYGFLTISERELFETLLSVNGIGPKLGMAILGTLSVEHLRTAVIREQPEVLQRVPGIGKKTAQKLVFDLKDKLASGLEAIPAGAFDDVNKDVLDALVSLGYSIVEAQTAIQALPPDAPPVVEERVRMALQSFI
jgi:holliday junction DNA helicase RuvA